MAIRRYKKISELDALASASLSTYVAGVDNGETVKITLDILASGVRDTINTLDNVRLTNLENYTASFSASTNVPNGTISSSAQITALGFISESVNLSSLNSFTASQSGINTAFTNGINSRVTTSSFNDFSASVHTEILAATNEQSFNGLISGSSQLTSSYDERYVLSGSITQTTWDNIASKPNGIISSSTQITSFGFVSGSYETTGRNILSGSILDLLPNGLVSGSSQVLGGSGVWSGSAQLPSGIVSSSTQVLGGSGVVSGSYETTGRGIISSSAQLPSGLISSSTQLPSGLVSSSIQVLGGSGVASGSYETTGRGILSGSVSYTDLTNIPNGIISSSAQLNGTTIDNLTITNLHTLYETSSVIYASGSNQLGDQLTDTQILSGSVQIVGGLTINGVQVSTQSFVDLSSLNTFTSSANTSITNLNNATSSYETKGRGIISSSAQITSFGFVSGSYETTGRGILSGSIVDLLPSGVVSGSTQVLGGSGVYSSSAQITGFETTGRGILSGSISYTSLTNIPSGIVSGASQITSLLPAGTLSGSAQITAFGFVSGSYETTGRGIISSSANLVTTSSFNEYTASISTASLVTSINNLNIYTASQSTASLVTSITNLNTFTASQSTASLVTSINNLNTYTASQSTASLVNRLNAIESVSGSWITESETGSFLRSLNGAISSSSQLTSSYDLRYELQGRGIISSSTQISGTISNVDYIDFNTASVTPAWKSGRVFWDNTDGTLAIYNAEADVTLQVGQENWTRVYNQTATTITNGTPVRISGTHGDVPEIALAQSLAVSGAVNLVNQIIGLATHDIEAGTFGYITTQGLVRGVNTSAYIDGDTLYVSSSAGQLTKIPPAAPYEIIPIGEVVKASPGGSGIIYVAVQQPLDFSDLSSTEVLGQYSNGDMWSYEGSGVNGKWKHKTIAEIGLVTTSSFNTYTASISTASLVTSITNLNSATSSYLTSLNGAISSSSQLTSSFDTRYTLSGSVVSSGGARVTTSDTAPTSSTTGDLWWKSNDGNLYVYYDSYWVIATDTISSLPSGVVSSSAQITAAGFATTGSNTFTGTNTFNDLVTLAASSGDEGGELLLAKSQTNNSLTGSGITIDSYRDRLRIFEQGGAARGVHIDLTKTPGGVAGELMWKASGIVNAGTFVTLDNIKATVTTSGQRGLSLAAVTSNFSTLIGGNYALSGGANGSSGALSVTTSASTAVFNWNFTGAGDISTYIITDTTNSRGYRIVLQIGSSYNNNLIVIERLY